MGIWRNKSKVEGRSLGRPTLPAPISFERPYGDDGPRMGPDAALRLADVWACVRALSDAAASLPLVPYLRLADGGRERYTGRLADLLQRPAPAMTVGNLVGTIVAHLNLHGNAYIGKYKDQTGRVAQLGTLDPRTVTVSLENGAPVYEVASPTNGVVSRHGTDDLIHIKALSVDGLVGLSPITQARQALGLSRSLAEHAERFAREGGRPSGILAIKGPLEGLPLPSGEDVAAARDTWRDQFAGSRPSGGTVVVTGGEFDYTQLSLSLADAQFVQQRTQSAVEVCRVFRVPPHMLGLPSGDSLTYANAESQALDFIRYSLMPWLTVVEQAISADPDLSPSNVYVEFLTDGFLRSDAATRASVYSQALDPVKGWMTRAEVRRLENLSAEPSERAA